MMSPWAWQHHRIQKALAARFVHPGALNAASGWHATSAVEADEIRAHGFRQPVCVAPNGVDRPSAGEIDVARAFWSARVPAVDTRPVALFYSRLHAKKRIIELIDLWAEAAPRDWLLLVVGVPEQFSLAHLRNHARRTGAADRIEIHAGTEAHAPYPVASLFVLPSHSENFGLVIAEAMAHGVPVLVTDSTPWAMVNDAELGWCVPWEEFGTALQRATATPPGELRALGSRARDWAWRELSWEKSARQLVEFYATLPAKSA